MKVLVLFMAAAAAAPSGEEILQKTAEAYRGWQSYQFVGQRVEETITPAGQTRVSTSVSVAAAPGKQRVEAELPGRGLTYRITNGKDVWEYQSAGNLYSRKRSAVDMIGDATAFYRDLDRFKAGAKLLREEGDTYVVEVPAQGVTLWIEKARWVVVQEMRLVRNGPVQVRTTILWDTVKVNQPVDDRLFEFDPPVGAVERPGE